MSSPPCLGTVERTCGFDLEMLKSSVPSPSSSARSSCSSECSSVVISTKRARTPRKRPNQSYAEAAILLSSVYPNVFNANSLPTLRSNHHYTGGAPFFAQFQTNYLIEEDPSPSPCRKLPCRFEFKSEAPGSPDYDVESILDEEEVMDEGIDGIMGKLSMENPDAAGGEHVLGPLLSGLVGFGIGGSFGQRMLAQSGVRHGLRGARGGEWWGASTMVEVGDIVPRLDAVPASAKKKKKSSKKKKKVVKDDGRGGDDDEPQIVDAAAAEPKPVPRLGLKLNYEDVVEAWSDRQFPFAKEAGGGPEFSADAIAKLAEVDLTPDTDGPGAREASVQRFREKRRTRLFSKKIRYQVRKVNADCRPRMKASGRFIRRPTSPRDEAEEGSP